MLLNEAGRWSAVISATVPRPEDLRRAELAAPAQHLGKAQVVAGRRDGAAAAQLPLLRLVGGVMGDGVGVAGDRVLGQRQRVAARAWPPAARSSYRSCRAAPTRAPAGTLPSGLPVTASTTKPSTSVEKPYSQFDARIEQQRRLGERGDRLVLRHALGRPHGGAGIERVRRGGAAVAVGEAGGVAQQVLDGRQLLRRARRAPPGSATFSSASGGRYFDTGSASSTRPSSTSIMTAVEVMALVMEAMEKMASVSSGSRVAGSR